MLCSGVKEVQKQAIIIFNLPMRLQQTTKSIVTLTYTLQSRFFSIIFLVCEVQVLFDAVFAEMQKRYWLYKKGCGQKTLSSTLCEIDSICYNKIQIKPQKTIKKTARKFPIHLTMIAADDYFKTRKRHILAQWLLNVLR